MNAAVATAKANKNTFQPLGKMTLFLCDDMKPAITGNKFGSNFEAALVGGLRHGGLDIGSGP